jgi:hypothetical protein
MSQLKIECARRQLGTALDLYLRDLDPVSVHCLANGGCEVIEHQARKAGAEPFVSRILKTRSDLGIKKLRIAQRKYWNAFKHALKYGKEREDDPLLAQFRDEMNDAALFVGWADYYRATKTMPIEAHMYQIWFIALYPAKLDPKHARVLPAYKQIFPGLGLMRRAQQKRELNKVIDGARKRNDLMSDPRTDRRPLVLDWTGS